MSMKKAVFGQVAILGAFLAVPLSGVLAADTGRGMGFGGERGAPTAAECAEKTGKTEAECQKMMSSFGSGAKRMGAPTVASCVEKMGKTEEECRFMMTSLDNRKSGEGSENPLVNERRIEREVKNDSNRPLRKVDGVDRFLVMETRISRVVAYLQSKQVPTTELESAVAVLKEKITSAKTAGVQFETARTTWKNDKADANKTALESARTTYKASVASVKTYYQGTVLPLMKTLLQSVTE